MAVRNRLGYNWKARHRSSKKSSHSFSVEALPEVELDNGLIETLKVQDDSNSLVLPGTKRVNSNTDKESLPKRKKLSHRQRKRLQKIVESKEKKAKVVF